MIYPALYMVQLTLEYCTECTLRSQFKGLQVNVKLGLRNQTLMTKMEFHIEKSQLKEKLRF